MKIQNLPKSALLLSTFVFLWIGVSQVYASSKYCQKGFLVFAGQDAKGSVVFAMETSQSKGDRWDWTQAEQAVWLFDEQVGWVKLKDRYGRTFEDNFGRRIGGDFESQFSNGIQGKMVLHSDANRIHLAVKADKVSMRTEVGGGQLMIANGEATFTWKERRMLGKVYVRNMRQQGKGAFDIYMQNNKGMHKEALYCAVGKSGFMGLMRTNEKSVKPLTGELSMSFMLDSMAGIATDIVMEATNWTRFGLYEFPTEWQGTFEIDGKAGMFKLLSFDYQTTEYLLFAGTRLTWTRGFLNFDGESYPIYGIAEVEGRFQGKKQIQAQEAANQPREVVAPGSTWEAIAHPEI